MHIHERYNTTNIHHARYSHHPRDSSYFNVDGMDTRADSTFLNGPPLTLHSICIISKLIKQEIRWRDLLLLP
jgi:hypothetical protein